MTKSKLSGAANNGSPALRSVQTLTRRLYWYPVLAMVLIGYVLSEYLEYGSFGRALMFQPNDQPYVPFEVRNTVVTPLLGQHFAGDLFLPYVNVREGILEAYYGASLLTLNLLKELEYRWIFLLFLLLSIAAIKWAIRFLCQNSDLRGPTVAAFLVTLPFLKSLDRGNVHGIIVAVLLAVVATFFASRTRSHNLTTVNLRTKWYDPVIFGAILSIKVYTAGVLLICFALSRSSPTHQKFLFVSSGAFVFFLLSPSLVFGENLLYWTLGGPNAQTYLSDNYFLATRPHNMSLLAILIDREWLSFASASTVSVVGIASLTLLLAFVLASQRAVPVSLVPHACFLSVIVSLLLPISGSYTLAVFGLPWIVACNERYSLDSASHGRSGDGGCRRYVEKLVNSVLLVMSSILLVPISTVVPGSPLPLTIRFVIPFVLIAVAVGTAWIAGLAAVVVGGSWRKSLRAGAG